MPARLPNKYVQPRATRVIFITFIEVNAACKPLWMRSLRGAPRGPLTHLTQICVEWTHAVFHPRGLGGSVSGPKPALAPVSRSLKTAWSWGLGGRLGLNLNAGGAGRAFEDLAA